MWGPELHCMFEMWADYRDLYNGRISSLFLYLKLRQWTPVFCRPFCSFSLFVFATWGLDRAVDLLSATVDWTGYRYFARCCVRCASHNIYLYRNSFGTCLPTQVYWYLPVIPLCNTILHFIETRLQNTIDTIIKIHRAWLTGWQVIW